MSKYRISRERIIFGVGLLLSVYVLPSTLTLLLGAFFVLRYPNYFEFAGAALLIDAIYRPIGMAPIGLFGFAVVFVLVADFLKERIRLRNKGTL